MDNSALALRRDEYLAGVFWANRVQGRRAYGGRLFITNQRLQFIPVAASQARGGEPTEIEMTRLSAVDVAPREMRIAGAALRHRLRVQTVSGGVEHFVVWRPRKLARLVQEVAIAANRSADSE
jgi:hypothetical protein